MSFQKAYKFCKLCHEYAQYTKRGADSLEADWFNRRDSATNETMSALHHVLGDKSGIFNKPDKENATKYLGECARCDYSEKKVANLVEDKF